MMMDIFNEMQTYNDVIEGITIEEALKKYEPMVYRFANTAHTNHVCSKEDLVQEGKMAIVIAFRTYDPTKKASLTTWVYHMIKDSILEYQKQHLSVLSGGAYLQSVLRKAGENASIEEIMEFGVSKKTAVAATYVKDSFSTVDYEELATVVGDSGLERFDTDTLDWKSYLNEEEIFAIGNFYGFFGQKLTMQEIGERLNKSRKSVSYMINKAIVKLRRIPGIEDYAFN
jgi:RNA polymerase sigma factor (sigma-70 family)